MEERPQMQMIVHAIPSAARLLRALGGSTAWINGTDMAVTFPEGTTFSQQGESYEICATHIGQQYGVYIPHNPEGMSLIFEEPPLSSPLTETQWMLTKHPYNWRDRRTLCDLWVNMHILALPTGLCTYGYCLENAVALCARCPRPTCMKHLVGGICQFCAEMEQDRLEIRLHAQEMREARHG